MEGVTYLEISDGRVESLGGGQVHTRRFSDAVGNELGGPDDYEDGVDVGPIGALDVESKGMSSPASKWSGRVETTATEATSIHRSTTRL